MWELKDLLICQKKEMKSDKEREEEINSVSE